MATQVQWRGGSTIEHDDFTGAAREVTVDTSKTTLVVHDNSTAGGRPLLREDQDNLPTSVTNGISVPSTNTVALSTNGTGRLFVDSSGNVVIGAAIAGGKLRVNVGTDQNISFNSDGSNSRISAFNDAVSASVPLVVNGSDLRFTTSGSERLRITSTGELKHIGGGSEGSPAVYFAGSAPSNSLYVQATTGNVGIGTTSPASALHVSGASGTTIRLDGTENYSSTASLLLNQDRAEIRTTIDASGGNPGGTLLFRTRNTSGSLVDALSINNLQTVSISSASGVDPLIVSNGGGEAFRVDGSRRLLVGTASDSGGALLQVNGDRVRIATAKTPASASDTGTAGEVCWDTNYIYVCTATNTWKRAALSTW